MKDETTIEIDCPSPCQNADGNRARWAVASETVSTLYARTTTVKAECGSCSAQRQVIEQRPTAAGRLLAMLTRAVRARTNVAERESREPQSNRTADLQTAGYADLKLHKSLDNQTGYAAT